MKDMSKKREENEKNPENHPMYSDEWKTFWNRRYKELQAGLHLLFDCRVYSFALKKHQSYSDSICSAFDGSAKIIFYSVAMSFMYLILGSPSPPLGMCRKKRSDEARFQARVGDFLG